MGNASSGSDGRLGDGRAGNVLLPKDGHVLRLWAEVFTAQHSDASCGTDLQWVKVTDDIVPVNVTCVEWKPQSTRFRIVAYNSQVDKVCDAYIDQPGHVIEQPAESFLHWLSKDTDRHWGLNFTSKEDAARFKAVCTMTAVPTVSKSTSFGTVRSRSKSAVRKDPKKSASSPSDIFHTISEGKARSQATDALLTMPRFQRHSPRRLDTRDLFQAGGDVGAVAVATDSAFADVRTTPRRPGATSAPASPSGEFPCFATVTVPGRNGTLCADNLRSILYDSGSLSSPRGDANQSQSATSQHAPATCDRHDNPLVASACSADDCDCTCSRDDAAVVADREDDTATIVGDHSTLIADVATPRSSLGSRNGRAVAAERDATAAAAVCLPGSIGPPADEEDRPTGVAGHWSLDDSCTSGLVPVLQSTPLVPGFGSEAGGGDPGISLPARVPPILSAGVTGNAGAAKRSLKPWLEEQVTRTTATEARRRVCSCADSGIGATCSESAESIRSSARSDIESCCSNGHLHVCGGMATPSSTSRKPGSSASSYSSEGSCRTASNKNATSAADVAVSDRNALTSAREDASGDGEDSDSCHSMTTVTATSSLLSLNQQACATRKAGWLEMKNWLVRRGRTVQLASRRQWKRYWVSLKGGTLLFYARSGSGAPLTRSSAGATDGRTRTALSSLESHSGSSSGSCSRDSRLGAALGAGGFEDGKEGCGRAATLAAANNRLDGRCVSEADVPSIGTEGNVDEGEEDDDEEGLPRHLLHVTDCLVQPVPEHPRRQHVFALSTHHGDAYLLQAPCLFDHDQWIATIHGACAAQYARQLGRDDMKCVLVGEVKRLQEEIEQDSKMKNMAELQLSTANDPKTSRAIKQQIGLWEKKQEGRYMDQYRFRCYLAALQGDGCGEEQPNPKSLLAAMSQSSRSTLSRLGVLSVTTFHALVCSRRSESYDAVLARCKHRKGGSHRGSSGEVTPRSLSTNGRAHSNSSSTVTPDREAIPACDRVVGIAKSSSSHSGLYRKSRHPSMNASRSAAADGCSNTVQRAFSLKAPSAPPPHRNILKRVDLPNDQAMAVSLKSDTTAEELLDYVCSKRQLTTSDCFLCLRLAGSDDFFCPRRGDCIGSMDLDKIEIRPKVVFQVELSRQDGSCGLQLEAELADGSEHEDELRVFVCALSPRSAAAEAGLFVGDEILVLNGKMVADLDMNFIENFVASASSLRMTVRSCRLAKPKAGPVTSQLMQHADIYISNMMCPPPPSQDRLPDKFIDELIVPAPSWVQAEISTNTANEVCSSASNVTMPLFKPKQQRHASALEPDHKIKELLMNAEQVTHLCRMANERVLDDADSPGFFSGIVSAAGGGSAALLPPSQSHTAAATTVAMSGHLTVAAAAGSSGTGSGSAAAGAMTTAGSQLPQPLSEAQRLRKVVVELIDTERAYVKDLNCLIDRYLEPLKEETFLSSEEVIHLFGNIQEIVHFQRQFLENLESAAVCPEFNTASKTGELKGVLHSIAGSFLYYANHFRLYSSFCASHSRAQKVFTTEENVQLKEFLRARNPKQQHSATLESYLIKPIQRVLKYPLLLAQLKNLSQANSDEQEHLCEALSSMEKVAEHINEMQKIYEEYGQEFDALMNQLNRHASSRGHRHQAEQQPASAVATNSSTPLTAARAAPAGAASPAAKSEGSRSGVPSLHRKVEINVGDLDYYGEAEWLNSSDFISKPKKGFVHVTTIFVFKNGIVFLCQEKPKSKKRGKGNASARTSVVESANSSCVETVVESRFLPVDCVQVRTLPTEHAHVAPWELLLLKSAVEGRAAEKNYVLAHSDVKIRDEFIQSIRTVIRESVDRMSLKGGSRHGNKLRVTSAADFLGRCPTPRSNEIASRYSMNFDLDGTHAVTLGDAEPVPERSRTIGDLHSADNAYGLAASDRASLSRASVGSTDSTGAKLVYSSQDPLSYSSKCGSLEAVDVEPGSPVWKQQHRLAPGGEAVSDPSASSGFSFPGAVDFNSIDCSIVGSSSAATAHLRPMLLPHGRLEGATEC